MWLLLLHGCYYYMAVTITTEPGGREGHVARSLEMRPPSPRHDRAGGLQPGGRGNHTQLPGGAVAFDLEKKEKKRL